MLAAKRYLVLLLAASIGMILIAPESSTAGRAAVAPPTSVRVTSSTTSTIALAWSSSGRGTLGYAVYVDGRRVALTSRSSATVTSLSCGKGYLLGVEAYDTFGRRSVRVPVTGATGPCGDTQAPTAPTDFRQAWTTPYAVTLAWSPSTDNTGVVRYEMYSGPLKIGSTPSPAYSFGGLNCGATSQVGVVALDAAGNRSARSSVMVITSACPDETPPTEPSGLEIAGQTANSVTVAWDPARDNVAVDEYGVYVGRNLARETPATSTTISNLSCGTTVTVGVDASDTSGNRSDVASVTTTTTSCPTTQAPAPPSAPTTPDGAAPTAPTGLTPTAATASTVSLSWSPSTDNVGVAGYSVYRDGTAVATSAAANVTLGGLTCGTSYAVGVQAYDGAGNRSPIAQLTMPTSACADTRAPSQPTNVALASRTTTSISITWSASSDDVGTVDYGLYLSGVRISQGSPTTYTFTGLPCGQNATLGVDAVDASGNRSSVTSVLIATLACPDTSAPTAPGSVSASNVTGTSATLNWAAANDNVGVTGYKVYAGATEVGQTTSLSFSVSGLSCGTTVSLGVAARDAAGNTSARATVTVATAPCPPAPAPPPTPAPTPAPTPGVIELTGSVSASAVNQQIASAPAGAVIVRPRAGASATVTGDIDLSRAQTTLDGLSLTGEITFEPGATGSKLLNSSAKGFNIFGADSITIQGNTLDGAGAVEQNFIWDQPAGNTPDGFVIRSNTFRNYYGGSGSHSEALYIGYSTNGLVESNTFVNNGSTAHVFFTYCGTQSANADGCATDRGTNPRNICVRGNSFGATQTAYYAVNFREEIPASANIRIDPTQQTVKPLIGPTTTQSQLFSGAC